MSWPASRRLAVWWSRMKSCLPAAARSLLQCLIATVGRSPRSRSPSQRRRTPSAIWWSTLAPLSVKRLGESAQPWMTRPMPAKRKPKPAEPVIRIKLSPTPGRRGRGRRQARSRAPGFASMITTVLSPADTGVPEEIDHRTSRSLLRGLAVLACFDAHEESLGLMEIAKRLEVSPSTIHRYLLTLVQVGLLEQSQETRRYSLVTTRKRRR